MISLQKYSPAHKNDWNDFVRASKTPLFMFDRDYMDYHADRFIDNSLMFYDGDELVAVLPASLHESEIRSHGGLTYGGMIVGVRMKQHMMLDCFDTLRHYCLDNGVTTVVYKTIPYIFEKQPFQEDLYALFRNNAVLLKVEPATVINLKDPIKMPKGRKAQISRARREGVIVKETSDFSAFIRLENEVLKKHHNTTAVHTAEEMALLHSRFPDNIICYGGFRGGVLIAGSIVYNYDNVMHTQYLAANDEAREIGALDLVVSEMIMKYKDTKKYLDFGISTEDSGKILNEGLIAQKEGFGGRTIAYSTYKWDLSK